MERIFFIYLISILFKNIAAGTSAVLAPNMSSCHLPTGLPPAETPFNCCAPPADYPLRLFVPKASSTSSLRIRRPAHLVDRGYAEKLAHAYELMKALPADDPRSFAQQANINCAYYYQVYNQMDFSDQRFQVQGSWLFLPFHRWYLYFHERILANLLGDDDFTLPFWNYDHPEGAAIPPLYSSYILSLVDNLRDTHDNPSSPAAIDYAGDANSRDAEKQLRENANSLFRSFIRDVTSPEDFFGGAYRAGDSSSDSSGTIESRLSITVQDWLGDKSQVGWMDMGSPYSAGRDVLFHAHHANVDRMWEAWKKALGRRDITDPDFLDAQFAFYNEDAKLMRVRVKDALDTRKLGYEYETREIVWKDAAPERRSVGEAKLIGNESMCAEGEMMTGACTIVMERDARAAEGEEFMQMKVEHGEQEMNAIAIYINLPSADAETDTGCEEFYVSVTIEPGLAARMGTNWGGSEGRKNSTFKTSSGLLRQRLVALELIQAASLIVTLVPRSLNVSAANLTLHRASLVTSATHVNSRISTA